MESPPAVPPAVGRARTVAIIAGPVIGLSLSALEPGGLTGAAAAVLGVALWMAIWWITECLPLALTAL